MESNRSLTQASQGSWLVMEDHLENGNDAFVNELRKIYDADRLGSFAAKIFADRRPASRRLLLAYLDLPFNTYRHEALLKRLFKLAEAASDDEVMAYFLVGFDRSLRHVKKVRFRYDTSTRQSWTEEVIRVPRKTEVPRKNNQVVFNHELQRMVGLFRSSAEQARESLFSTATRRYLRRRAWRYFRNLGKTDLNRYVAAVSVALKLYRDDDVQDGLQLLDNWGLMHILFRHSPILVATTNGWRLAPSCALRDLQPAPAFVDAWTQHAESLIDLVENARCTAVRQWSLRMLQANHQGLVAQIPLGRLIRWISSDLIELSQLGLMFLEKDNRLSALQPSQWLELTQSANPKVLDQVCELMKRNVSGQQYSLVEVVDLCNARPTMLAQMGLEWLETRAIASRGDCEILLRTINNAPAEASRAELATLVVKKLSQSGHANPDDVLELLDSRHREFRDAGWKWLLDWQPAGEDPALWQKLIETPYEDVRLKLISFLEAIETRNLARLSRSRDGAEVGTALQKTEAHPRSISIDCFEPAELKLLWASVLLNIHRGGRQKVKVLSLIMEAMQRQPELKRELLPLLRVALRSVRSVESQSALVAITEWVDGKPELAKELQTELPELTFFERYEL